MSFYTYIQNNSGGCFSDPAHYVIVEAGSAAEADERAESVGVYFDGVAKDRDCDCCGDRWDRAYDGKERPEIYGKPPELHNSAFFSKNRANIVLLRAGRALHVPRLQDWAPVALAGVRHAHGPWCW